MATGSFYNPEEEFMKMLTQTMSSSEGESPAIIAPEVGTSAVRQERLAAQGGGIPQGGIAGLMANIGKQNDLLPKRIAAQDAYAEAQAQTPHSGFRKKGGTWAQAFKDPGAGQRNFMISAGLALATSDPTKNLSQRIGMALGSGTQSMMQTRAAEQDKETAKAKAEVSRLGLQQEGLENKFGQQKDMLELQNSQAIAAANRIKQEKEEKIANAAEKRAATKFNQSQSSREITDYRVVDSTTGDVTNVFKGVNGQYFRTDEGGGFRRLNEEELSSMYEPESPGISIGENGQLVMNPLVEKEVVKTDQKLIRDYNKKIDEAQNSIAALAEMSALLDAGVRTGGLSFVSSTVGKGIRSVEEELGVEIPFLEDAQNQYRMIENFDTLSRQLGVEGLRLFGGSDTERELLVSLSIQPNSKYAPEINRAILKRKQLAYDILSVKGDVMNRWVEENGSLQARNKEGIGFNKAWHDYQKQAYTLKNEAMVEELKDYKGYGAFKDDLGAAAIRADSYEEQAIRKKRLDQRTRNAFSIINGK